VAEEGTFFNKLKDNMRDLHKEIKDFVLVKKMLNKNTVNLGEK
jgi:hypothetical protein